MSATPINLNKRRKEQQRSLRRKQADENAVKFGRSKSEKTQDQAQNKLQITRLDSHKRTP